MFWVVARVLGGCVVGWVVVRVFTREFGWLLGFSRWLLQCYGCFFRDVWEVARVFWALVRVLGGC